MFPSVIFLFSLLALVQAIPGPGLQRRGSLCHISLIDVPWTQLEAQEATWDAHCVQNFPEENENPTDCQLKLFRPNKAAPNDPELLQTVAIDDWHLKNGFFDFDLLARYTCENGYVVKLVCQGRSGRYVLVAESDHFEICIKEPS
ncbi:hypothetical protein BC827DRAFT_1250969 [Russula dissimulans]|nr:hypothetical protein BC827DRAFT_1250969 [Russula dissimulans]